MKKLWKAKLGAFGIHILFSASIISIFMLIITQLWFPDELFNFENVWEGLRILVPVDAIIGPLLTLVIFVPGKKGLKMDLSIIVSLQIAALVYGASTIYSSRPEILAFVGDRFEVITRASYNASKIDRQYLKQINNSYPALVYPLPAQNPDELSHFVIENVQYQLMSDRYRPLNHFHDKVMSRSLDIDRLEPTLPDDIAKLNSFRKTYNSEQHALFILQGTTKDFIIVSLNMKSYEVAGYLTLDPWEVYKFPPKN